MNLTRRSLRHRTNLIAKWRKNVNNPPLTVTCISKLYPTPDYSLASLPNRNRSGSRLHFDYALLTGIIRPPAMNLYISARLHILSLTISGLSNNLKLAYGYRNLFDRRATFHRLRRNYCPCSTFDPCRSTRRCSAHYPPTQRHGTTGNDQEWRCLRVQRRRKRNKTMDW